MPKGHPKNSTHPPDIVRARRLLAKVGGLVNLDAATLVDQLGIDRKVAWRLMYQLRKGDSKPFIHPTSAAGKLLGKYGNAADILNGADETHERAFIAAIQFIGVARAETLLKEFKDKLIFDMKDIQG